MPFHPDAPRTHPERGCPLATAFRSPAKISAYAASVTRSTFLTCCFACESIQLPRPFRLPLHCQARFAPFSAASTLQTRCGIALGFRRPRFQLRLPLRTVISLRINASTGFAACQPTFQGCPISVRSPQPFSISRFGCGSSFPARYCPVGLLFLKLGTLSCLQHFFSVLLDQRCAIDPCSPSVSTSRSGQ
jgi:hypothetical protein